MDKKGISIMIGYVLLISMTVIMSVVIYQWLKTYVPTEGFDCPDEVSLFIKDYTCTDDDLTITLKNNGNFNLSGYFIRAATEAGQDVAALDLSESLESGGQKYQDISVLFATGTGNPFGPNEEATHSFDISNIDVYFIEVIPMRFQTENNKLRIATCTNGKVKEELTCG